MLLRRVEESTSVIKDAFCSSTDEEICSLLFAVLLTLEDKSSAVAVISSVPAEISSVALDTS
ncbi:hypothetical protein D3C76_1284190 [compost metagenome]